MKRMFILTIGFFLIINIHAIAQVRGFRDVLIGPSVGFGDSWINLMTGSYRYMPSGYAGLTVMAYRSEYFAWGGQVTASSEGYKLDYYGNRQTVRVEYIRVPLQMYYFAEQRYSTLRPYMHFGPSFGVQVAENDQSTLLSKEATPRAPLPLNKYDVGLNAGIGLKWRLTKKMSVNGGFDYYKGLTDVVNGPTKLINLNHNVDVNIGLLFRVSKF